MTTMKKKRGVVKSTTRTTTRRTVPPPPATSRNKYNHSHHHNHHYHNPLLRLRIRPCVWKFLFWIPTIILVGEQFITIWFSISSYDEFNLAIEDTWKEFDMTYNKKNDNTNFLLFLPSSSEQAQQLVQRISHVRPIRNITQTKRIRCPSGLQRMFDVIQHTTTTTSIEDDENDEDNNNNNRHHHQRNKNKSIIPRMVHQTSISRCITPTFTTASYEWILANGGGYYFHDQHAIYRLLYETYYPEFPHLNHILQHCPIPLLLVDDDDNGNYNNIDNSLQLGLWKFIVMWMYGGVYADLNIVHTKETLHLLHRATEVNNRKQDEIDNENEEGEDDGILIFDPKSNQIRLDFMAMTPRHPLMYYTIQNLITYILRDDDGHHHHHHQSNDDSSNTFVRTAFTQAIKTYFDQERKSSSSTGSDNDNNKTHPNIRGGGRGRSGKVTTGSHTMREGILYIGPQNRTIRILGKGEGKESSDKYLKFVIQHPSDQKKEYVKMNKPFMKKNKENGSTRNNNNNGDIIPQLGNNQQQQQHITPCFRSMLDGWTTGNVGRDIAS